MFSMANNDLYCHNGKYYTWDQLTDLIAEMFANGDFKEAVGSLLAFAINQDAETANRVVKITADSK